MINWLYFPQNTELSKFGKSVVKVFEDNERTISSHANNDRIGVTGNTNSHSNTVLAALAPDLQKLGFRVETGKLKNQKIYVPVLFGEKGKPIQSFDADAFCARERFVLEIEAGRAVTNYQFLKDFFQACVMVDVDYLAIAVRNIYKTQKDYEKVCTFFSSLYASGRVKTELKGILIIGY